MAKSELFHELLVHLPSRDYPIVIGDGILADMDIIQRHVSAKQAMIVTNKTIAPLYLHFLQKALVDKQCDVVILDDGEQYKNEHSLLQIYDALIEKQHHRDTTLIALGGGVIGDITGFAAATYQRGVNFLQVPTTLLAQVDASVGGKTAINHPLAKNMIGSFYQPDAVIMDLRTLTTLPKREFNAGCAEIIKYAILAGGDFLGLVHNALKRGLANAPDLPEIISQCCQIKADYVQKDERETGLRALLNLGHTIGHALEAYTHYKRWLHGEAVAIGLYSIALLSQQFYGLDKTSLELVDELLSLANLPRYIPRDINLETLRALMLKDKKIKNNTLRLILVKAMGNCYIEEHVTESMLQTVLQSVVEGE